MSYVLLGVADVVLLYGGYIYNRLITLRLLMREAWSNVDVHLKKRHDLVPNLVELVKGYATHEKSVLESISAKRGLGNSGVALSEQAQVEQTVTQDFKNIFAIAEAYPDLKADKNFRQLQSSLVEIEDGLEHARRYYNGCVRNYNVMVESFPSAIIASVFNYRSASFFEIELATERSLPKVEI